MVYIAAQPNSIAPAVWRIQLVRNAMKNGSGRPDHIWTDFETQFPHFVGRLTLDQRAWFTDRVLVVAATLSRMMHGMPSPDVPCYRAYIPNPAEAIDRKGMEVRKECKLHQNHQPDSVGVCTVPGIGKLGWYPNGQLAFTAIVKKAEVVCACAARPRTHAPLPRQASPPVIGDFATLEADNISSSGYGHGQEPSRWQSAVRTHGTRAAHLNSSRPDSRAGASPPPFIHQSSSAGSGRSRTFAQQQLADVMRIARQLSALVDDYVPPETLTFQSSASRKNLVLTPDSVNRPLLAFEDSLTSLMILLDGVDSNGDATVRAERKRVVKRIEAEFDYLDQFKQRLFVERAKLEPSILVRDSLGGAISRPSSPSVLVDEFEFAPFGIGTANEPSPAYLAFQD